MGGKRGLYSMSSYGACRQGFALGKGQHILNLKLKALYGNIFVKNAGISSAVRI
jgi:hypothetical protein